MTPIVEIWHNPRCSKSRAALAYLEDKGLAPVVRLYLKDSPDADTLNTMLDALTQPAAAILRKEGAALSDRPRDEIVAALVADPALIERPVVRIGKRAVVARPTELIDGLLD